MDPQGVPPVPLVSGALTCSDHTQMWRSRSHCRRSCGCFPLKAAWEQVGVFRFPTVDDSDLAEV